MFDSPIVKRLIALAIEEDLALGDATAQAAVDADLRGSARIVAREKMVACCLPLIAGIFESLRWPAEIELKRSEGEYAEAETDLAVIRGNSRHLLAAERTILNFLQRACGVATFARRASEAAGAITLLDTRKTMPGWRALDKYAVRIGGASNHRYCLGDMILVKNNHIDANGGDIRRTLRRVFDSKPPYIAVEVEVRDMEELKAALEFDPDIIMLDNFSDGAIAEALKLCASRRAKIEVSGGIDETRLGALEKLGVRYVSMGALTTQARNVDISMRLSFLPA